MYDDWFLKRLALIFKTSTTTSYVKNNRIKENTKLHSSLNIHHYIEFLNKRDKEKYEIEKRVKQNFESLMVVEAIQRNLCQTVGTVTASESLPSAD